MVLFDGATHVRRQRRGGAAYATTRTQEKYWLTWKEDVDEDDGLSKLDKYLLRMCRKDRLIELCRDFMLFDGGEKKVPRVHQYFGIKAGQEHVKRREGGIIWHTQGSGKSIVMVLLAKWILENNPNARVAVITDRDELDKQILGVFREAGRCRVTRKPGHPGRQRSRSDGQTGQAGRAFLLAGPQVREEGQGVRRVYQGA